MRKDGTLPYLRPDGKTQVTVRYEDDRPAAARHGADLDAARAEHRADRSSRDLVEHVITPLLPTQFAGDDPTVLVNPTGKFVLGGPHADTGLTGRKIIVDTYGGAARHGGGAFSGKDPSKVDRSAAYAARWVAKHVVAAGAAAALRGAGGLRDRSGRAGVAARRDLRHRDRRSGKIETAVRELFDLRPAAIVRDLDLRRPVYQPTAAYGHFGRRGEGFTWEATPRLAELKSALGL